MPMENTRGYKPERTLMLDSARGKMVAALAMMACCGLSMAIAIGVIAFSSTMVISGLAVAVAVGCIAFMMAFGHQHRHHDSEHAAQRDGETDSVSH
jgi:uncharacterized membrane protein YdfJ with MMPL/SSD domain